jgi:hypothetical protein
MPVRHSMTAATVATTLAAGASVFALAAAPVAVAAPSCPPLPAKERVQGYAWLNKGLSVEWKVLCSSAAAAGPRLYATKAHISSNPVTVARWMSSHLDSNNVLDAITGTNPVGLRLMRPRIRGFLYDAFLTGFRVRGKP